MRAIPKTIALMLADAHWFRTWLLQLPKSGGRKTDAQKPPAVKPVSLVLRHLLPFHAHSMQNRGGMGKGS